MSRHATVQDLLPFRKKPKPDYMRQERQFAKRSGMRQTISSGRIGIMKGDSFDSVFVVDNKQTGSYEYGLDRRDWEAFAKRAIITRRLPILQIEFLKTIRRVDESTETTKVVVMDYNDWERMREASGWTQGNGRDGGQDQKGTQRAAHQTAGTAKRSKRSR